MTGFSEIYVGQGLVALVDSADIATLIQHRWCVHVDLRRNWRYAYAYRTTGGRRTPQKTIYMHRILASAPEGMKADHENGNTLDNRRQNLRTATHQQNSANRRVIENPYGLKGVRYVGGPHPWVATIKCKGRTRYSEYLDSVEAAGEAYDQMAREEYGEFAATNALLLKKFATPEFFRHIPRSEAEFVPVEFRKPRYVGTGRKRGFGSMPPEQRQRIASMGGKAARPENRSFSRDPALAKKAGSIGGRA